MKNPITTPRSADLGLLLVRAPMGIYFTIAGIGKLSHGLQKFVDSQLPMASHYMPHAIATTFLTLLPFAELTVGILLTLGLLARWAGFIGSLLLISFIIAATGVKDPPKPFSANLIFLGVTLLIFLAGAGEMSLDKVLRKTSRP